MIKFFEMKLEEIQPSQLFISIEKLNQVMGDLEPVSLETLPPVPVKRLGNDVIFTASTQMAFRQRGVQTTLLHTRLAFAAAMGCDLAVVQTKPGSASQRNVQRLDFRLAYTKVTMLREWW